MSFLRSASPLRPPRHDLYLGIHRASAPSCETLRRVGSMDSDDDAELAETLAGVEPAARLLSRHLEHENAVIHPALEAVHRALPSRPARITPSMTSLSIIAAQVEPGRREPGLHSGACALRLYRLLAIFIGENFLHMHVETDHNDALWFAHTDAELVALEHRIHAMIPPAEMALALRWMIPAMTPARRLEVIGPLDDLRPHLDARALAKLEGVCGAPPEVEASSAFAVENDRPREHQPEAPAAGLFDAQVFAAVGQAARQQDQPRIEVVAQFGQPQNEVEAQFAVGELAAAALRMLAQELPEDRAGHALDEVVVVDEDAVVATEVPDRSGARGCSPPQAVSSGLLVGARLQRAHGEPHLGTYSATRASSWS